MLENDNRLGSRFGGGVQKMFSAGNVVSNDAAIGRTYYISFTFIT